MGVTVDPKTGNPLGNVPQVLQFQNNFIPAQATSAIQYAANLPTTPTTTASSTAAGRHAHRRGRPQPCRFHARIPWCSAHRARRTATQQ